MPDETLWPPLPYDAWKDTCSHLHLMTQIVGKVRLAQTPWVNHSWHVTLYVTPRGLTTGPIPHGNRIFDIDFDFIAHELHIRTSEGGERKTQTAAAIRLLVLRRVMDGLRGAERARRRSTTHPNEIPNAIPFTRITPSARTMQITRSRFWRALIQADRIFNRFRTSFLGKVSPVHFFWGSFDLAVTRFSGRSAPLHPGGVPALPDAVTREAYSHEVSSAGFWPGGAGFEAAFYSYAYPEPDGFRDAAIRPSAGVFSQGSARILLPYEAVRTASDPERMLLDFLYSTYDAAAIAGRWDRAISNAAKASRPSRGRSVS